MTKWWKKMVLVSATMSMPNSATTSSQTKKININLKATTERNWSLKRPQERDDAHCSIHGAELQANSTPIAPSATYFDGVDSVNCHPIGKPMTFVSISISILHLNLFHSFTLSAITYDFPPKKINFLQHTHLDGR